jgi:hypothetical protein
MRTASSAAISVAFADSSAAFAPSAVATVASNCCFEITSFSTSGVYRFRSSWALTRTGVDADDGHVDPRSFIAGLSALETGLILLYGYFEVFGVNFSDECPGLDQLVLLDVNVYDLPRYPGADLDQMAVNLGVVRVFVVRGVPPEQQGSHDENRHYPNDDEPPLPLFARRIVEILLVVVVGLGTLFDGSHTA